MKDKSSFSTSLRLNVNGKWSYRIKYYDDFGKRREIERTVGRKVDTLKALADMLEHMESGGITENICVGALFDMFICEKVKQLKPTTINDYKYLYRNYISVCAAVRVNDLKPRNIKAAYEAPKGATVRQKVYDLFKLLLRYAYQLGYVDNINCIGRLPRPQRNKTNIKNISVDELGRILQVLHERAANNDYRAWLLYNFVLLSSELGTRRGELCGLSWDCVNLDQCYIDIKFNLVYDNGKTYIDTPKTSNAVRRLYLSAGAVDTLRDIKSSNNINRLKYGQHWKSSCYGGYDLVWRWQDGTAVHPDWFTARFKKIQIELGFEKFYRIHDLRHYNAAVMVANGVDFKTVQARLGHADISTTLKIYAYSLDEQQQKAVEVVSQQLYCVTGGKTGGN